MGACINRELVGLERDVGSPGYGYAAGKRKGVIA